MTTISLDISTKFIAYALWNDNQLIEYGKLYSDGIGDIAIGSMATRVIQKFYNTTIDTVVYESAFLGTNVNVVKQLSKTIGSIIGAFYELGVRRFIAIPPITWQTGIGVGKSTQKDKDYLKKKYPNKSISWLKNKDRENRKQKVIDFVNGMYNKTFVLADNDIADAIGIGHYWNNHGV